MFTGMQYLVGTVIVLVVLRALLRGANLGDMYTVLKHDVLTKGGKRPRR